MRTLVVMFLTRRQCPSAGFEPAKTAAVREEKPRGNAENLVALIETTLRSSWLRHWFELSHTNPGDGSYACSEAVRMTTEPGLR